MEPGQRWKGFIGNLQATTRLPGLSSCCSFCSRGSIICSTPKMTTLSNLARSDFHRSCLAKVAWPLRPDLRAANLVMTSQRAADLTAPAVEDQHPVQLDPMSLEAPPGRLQHYPAVTRPYVHQGTLSASQGGHHVRNLQRKRWNY